MRMLILNMFGSWFVISGVTGRGQGGRVFPRDFWLGNLCWRIGKKVKEKKEKGWKLRRKKHSNCKREGGKLEMKVGKVIKRGEDFLFFFFFFFFFFAFHFWKRDRKLFWVYQNGKFSTGKKHFTSGKNSGKMTLPPQKNRPVMPLFVMIVFY